MSIIDTIKKKVTDYQDTREIEETRHKYEEEQARYKRAEDKLEAKGTIIQKSTLPADVKSKRIEELIAKRDKDLSRAPDKPLTEKISASIKEKFRPLSQEEKDAQMERKIKTAEQNATLRRYEREARPANPPGRPASKAKQGRGEFTAPSYKGGRGYGGGFDIGPFSSGLEPRRGGHVDPFGGLRSSPASAPRQPQRSNPNIANFADPFAMMNMSTGTRKAAPPAPKKKKKSKDVVIRISRNPMIKGLGAVVGLPGHGRKPRGRNPFDF